ncbi:MAG: hypothetical protein MJY78_07990 [Fibrobacter sp.]|nr:hypothetical protein [Fibrobacter sp.]
MGKMARAVLFAMMAVFSTAVFAAPCVMPANLTEIDGVYQIGTCGDLYKFAEMVNGGETDINGKLTADIDLNGSDSKQWTPIGTESTPYAGIFDGKDGEGNVHVISGLYFNDENVNYVGLFGIIDYDAKVQNVGVVDSYIRGAGTVGGVVGLNAGGFISNVYNTGVVSGSSNVGGVAGNNGGTVSNVYNTGAVSGSSNVGGVVGNNGGTVSNVYNTGAVSGTDGRVGGVVGNNGGTLSNVYNTGAVSGIDRVGGVVGYNSGTVSNVYNTGAVSGNNVVGGVVGNNDRTVSNVYNTGAVSGEGLVGGVVGANTTKIYVAYYNTDFYTGNAIGENANEAKVSHVEGKTTAELIAIDIGPDWVAGNLAYDKTTGKLTASFPYLEIFADFQYKITALEFKVVDNVIQIANADDLKDFARLVNEFGVTDVDAKLTADICLNACGEGESVLKADGTLNGDGSNFTQWTPIGTFTKPFVGTFDGAGHIVYGMYFNDAVNDIGLFRWVGSEGKVMNVGVEDSYLKGAYGVGGVVSDNKGIVDNVYNTGSVNGTGACIGGIVGSNVGTVSDSYNTGIVIGGGNYVGGVVGYSSGKIYNAYNTGRVEGTNEENEGVGGIVGVSNIGAVVSNVYNTGDVDGVSDHVGGVAGANRGSISNAYFNTDFFDGDAIGSGEGSNVEGKKTTELAALDVTLAFENSDGVWNGGYYIISNGWRKYAFPSLKGVGTAPTFIELDPNATEVEISNVEELFKFAEFVNAGNTTLNGKLTADIVVNENLLGMDNANVKSDGNFDVDAFKNTHASAKPMAWTPIGTNEKPYTGTFDGNGKSISGLYFNDDTTAFVGVFGILDGAVVKNVGVEDSYFRGLGAVGAVVGLVAEGEVSNVYSKSIVSGKENVGGIVGVNVGKVADSDNMGSVSGKENVGGVAGTSVGKVMDSYNTGTVRGSLVIGGVVGHVRDKGQVDKVYNTGAVSGGKFVGGVIGYNDASFVGNMYNTGSVSGTDLYVGGVVGGVDNKGSVSNVYNMGSVSGPRFTIAGGVVGFDNSAIISNAYFNTDFYTGNALGSGEDVENVGGKTSAELAAGTSLKLDTTAWVVGAVSENVKRDTLYYPYLKVFGPHKYVLGDVKKYAITVAVNDKTMGTVTGAGTYEYGTKVEIKAVANEGYKFTDWEDDVKTAARTITVTKAETYTANFEAIPSSSSEVESCSSAAESSSSETESSSSEAASSSSEAKSSSSEAKSSSSDAESSSSEAESSSSEAKSSSSDAKSSSSQKESIIAQAQLPQFSVTASGKMVSIAGARPNSIVNVFDMQGNMVKTVVATSANFTFALPSAGVYIVKNGYTAKRVNVR